MIRETGTVIKRDDIHIWVETSVKSTCSTCSAKSHCGTSAVASAVAGKTLVNRVENKLDAQVGDRVEIGVPEETLLSGAFFLYLFPLLLAIASALAGQFWLSRFIEVTEGIIILLTLLGGGTGFYLAKLRLAKESESGLQPKLLKVLPSDIEVKQVS